MHLRRLSLLAAALSAVFALAAAAQEDQGSGSDAPPAADATPPDSPPAADAAPAADSGSGDGSGSDAATADSGSGSSDSGMAGLQGKALALAKKTVLNLPIVKELIAKYKLAQCGDSCVKGERDGITIYLFPSKAGTHALIVPKEGMAMAGSSAITSKIFGDAKVNAAALVVSAAEASIDTSSVGLPDDVAKLIADANGGDANLSVKKGVAAFAVLTPGKSGLLGKVAKVTGVNQQAIKINGALDSEALRALFSKGGKGSRSLTLILPAATPMPFSKINNKNLFHLTTNSTRLSLSGEEASLKVDGSIDATVWIRGKELKVPITLAVNKGGGNWDVALNGSVNPPDGKDALGIGMPVKTITVSLTSSGQSKQKGDTQLALGAKITLHGRDLMAQISMSAPGGKVEDVSVALTDGDLLLSDIPKLGSLPSAKEFKLVKPIFGFHPVTKDAYLAGDLTWAKKSITARAVVMIQEKPKPTVTLLLDSQGVTLKQLAPSLKLPKEIEDLLKLPKGLITLSTAKTSQRLKASELPAPVRAMLEAQNGPTSGSGGDAGDTKSQVVAAAKAKAEKLFTIPDGFALNGKLDPAKAPAKVQKILTRLGIKKPILINCSIKGLVPPGGEVSINVTGDLGVIEPPEKQPKGLKLKSAQPKFFIAAVKSKLGAEVEIGIETVLGFQVGKSEMPPIVGKMYAKLSAAEQAIRFTGKMDGMWQDPLGMGGVAFGDVVAGFGFNSTSQVHLALGGKANFSPKDQFELAMILDLTMGTGIPTPEKVGFLLKAKELNPLFPFVLMEKAAVAMSKGSMGGVFKDQKMKAAFAKFSGGKSGSSQQHGKKLPLDLFKFVGVGDQPVTLYFASPGVSDPDLPAFDSSGIKVIGAAKFQDHVLGSLDAKLSPETGMEVHATIADFQIPKGKPLVALKNARLDMLVPAGAGIKDGYFKMSGEAKVLLFKGKMDVEMSAEKAKFMVENDWGNFGKAKITCESIGPLKHPEDFSLSLQLQMTGLKNIGKKLHEEVQKHAAEQKAHLAEKLNIPKTRAKLDADRKHLDELKHKKHKSLKDDKEIAKLAADIAKQGTELGGKEAAYKSDALVWDAIDGVAKAGNISIDNFELVDARLKGAMEGKPVTIKAKMTVMNKKIDGKVTLSLMKPGEMNLKELAKAVAQHLEKELKPHKKKG